MKKILFLLILTAVADRLSAQTPQARPKQNNQGIKVDSAKKQDNMPVIKPQGSSTMPVITPTDNTSNSNMPVVKPKENGKEDNRRKAEPKPL